MSGPLAWATQATQGHRFHSLFVAAVLLSLTNAPPAWASPGDLDTAFSGDGRITTAFTERIDAAFDLAIQGDGKIIAAGEAGLVGPNPRFALARYNPDGSLDTTFSGDGKVTTDLTSAIDTALGVGIQGDGKIVAAGKAGGGVGANSKFGVVRYNPDGGRDPTFSGDGMVTTDMSPRIDSAEGVVIQPDGKIVVCGGANLGFNSKFGVTRYNPDGTLDTTFDGDGKVLTDFTPREDLAYSCTVQADGKIVAAGGASFGGPNGDSFAVARYNSDGMLDTTFSGDGKTLAFFTQRSDIGRDAALQSDGKIVVSGTAGLETPNPRFALARFNLSGSLDATFGGNGRVMTDFVTSRFDGAFGVAIQGDGKIVAAGGAKGGTSNSRVALARYNPDGSLDTTFSGDGKVTTEFTEHDDYAEGVSIQADGNIVVAGPSGLGGPRPRFGLARYLAA